MKLLFLSIMLVTIGGTSSSSFKKVAMDTYLLKTLTECYSDYYFSEEIVA